MGENVETPGNVTLLAAVEHLSKISTTQRWVAAQARPESHTQRVTGYTADCIDRALFCLETQTGAHPAQHTIDDIAKFFDGMKTSKRSREIAKAALLAYIRTNNKP